MRRFKNCCAGSNDGQTLEVSIERFQQLVEAEAKLNVIRDVAASEDRNYGYGSEVSNTIDTILGIKRWEK